MMISKDPRMLKKWLDWLEGQRLPRFVLFLYLSRWAVIFPAALLNGWLFPGQVDTTVTDLGTLHPLVLFLAMVVVNPLFEMLIECALPYWVLGRVRLPSGRPWLFIFVSASLMALLHPLPAALIPSLVTGFFLAYTYGHCARQGILKAMLWTTLFHGGINLVGYVLLVLAVI